jgi:hypothetical protein
MKVREKISLHIEIKKKFPNTKEINATEIQYSTGKNKDFKMLKVNRL